MYNKLLIIFLFFSIPLLTRAFQKNSTQPLVVVDLIVDDSSMLNKASIQFEMFKNDINSDYTQQTDVYNHSITKRETRIVVPLSTAINYGRIKYFFEGQLRLQPFDEMGPSLYIFENNDTVQIRITKTDISFTGDSAGKYQCIQNINERAIHTPAYIPSNIMEQKKFDEMFDLLKAQVDSLFNVRLDILQSFKSKVSSEIYTLIKADCLGTYYGRLVGLLLSKCISAGKRNEYNEAVGKIYNKWFATTDYRGLSDNALVKSAKFCDFLLMKERFEVTYFISPKPNFYNYRYTFEEILNPILSKYSGIIQDKLKLLAVYYHITGKDDTSNYLQQLHASMNPGIYKNSLTELLKNYSGPAYPFELPDQYGKIRRLSDFKGKLIVMDFWFTGCGACSQLAIQMKPIIESYVNNKDVVFISVSVDESKEIWLKSVEAETYSRKEDINLITDEQADKHPLLKHYNIQGYPTLLIISKEGRLITSTPPRPKKGVPENTVAFKMLINKNL